jgi:3-hydroxybutyrate dehydrogenase
MTVQVSNVRLRHCRYPKNRYANEGFLAGKTVLVTGAASGIGRAIARHLYDTSKARIIAVDINAEGLTDLQRSVGVPEYALDLKYRDRFRQHLLSPTERVIAHSGDLTNDAYLQSMPTEVDVLINCAGELQLHPLDEYPEGLFARILRLMLEAPALLSQRVLPYMKHRGWGRLIHISSTMGLRAQPYKAAYVTAKHGLEGLSKVIALEGAPHGVTSNTVVLSHMDTPLLHRQVAQEPAVYGLSREDYLDNVLLAPLPIKQLLPPAAVARDIARLYGPGSEFITGSSQVMDCGWTGG